MARVDEVLEQAFLGRAGLCLIVGDAGLGKTALCRSAMERAARINGSEARVLSAKGVEDEAVFAYNVLADLLEPLSDVIPQIPERQRPILEGIIGRSTAPMTEAAGVGAALLSVLAIASERHPLLIVVDDVHWSDPISLEALAFALRRLDADPIATLLTSRPPVPHQVSGFVPTVELSGLSEADALDLMRSIAPGIEPSVARRLASEAAGNPLVLTELPTLLTRDQLMGRAALPDPLPVGPHMALSFARPMQMLPAGTRQALAVLALAGSAADRLVGAALEILELDVADLAPAEEARLVEVRNGTIEFRHPVIRTTAMELVGGAQRRAIHAALAVAARELDRERYPWELDRATVGPSEEVAEAFEVAAASVASRRGLAAAARMLSRAAEVGTRPERRPERLMAAAQAAFLAGDPQACLTRLDELDAAVGSPPPQAVLLRTQVGFWIGALPDYPRLLREGDQIATVDPDTAARIFDLVGLFAIRRGDMDVVARARARQVSLKPGLQVSTAATVTATGAFLDLLTDDWAAILNVLDDDQLWALLRCDDPLTGSILAHGLIMADRPDLAFRRASEFISDHREVNAITPLPYVLTLSGQASHLLGHWSQAESAVEESRELGEQTGQIVLVANALAYASVIAAARGARQRCEQLAAEGDVLLKPFEQAAVAVPLHLHHARGLSALGDGRIDDACHHLQKALDVQSSLPSQIPTFSRFGGDVIEALSLAGRRAEAAEVLACLESMRAARWSPWLNAVAQRGHGLIDDDDQTARFEQALRTHPDWDSWEIARTRLCYGRHLRRLKHRREASEQLHAALATFERLGAPAWALKAQQELRTTGVGVAVEMRRPTELTPQELRVALAVAAGGTNREIAAALFLSAKTVEHHLGRTYVKLGVTSRTQLARAVADGQLDALTA